ncbi:MAG: hypothetical protein IPK16_14855 [Anaerolineales bacterium]|nr:hypothetical protein [Anaerolineales bacterium]
MKGDFSRISFQPQRHYAAVMMQQGRVQTDADATEAQLIHLHRDDATARDVIGSCGAPKDEAGFEITSNGNTLFIGPGRYYVDGILCQNTQATLDYGAQPDLPGATLDDIRKAMEEHQTDFGIVYLDVWRRHVTALEDPLLRERALGGPDTATRLQTTWQVRFLPVRAGGATDKRGELEGRVADAKGALTDINAKRDPVVSQIPGAGTDRCTPQ